MWQIRGYIETNIRIGLHEYPEAEYCAKRGLKKQENNYELYLLLVEICYLTIEKKNNIFKWRDYCIKALEYSIGSDDEAMVLEICNAYLKELENR